MKYILSRDYGFKRFTVRYHNKDYKATKIGYYYSSVWEAYVIVVFKTLPNHKEEELRFPLKSQPKSDAVIEKMISELKRKGVLELSND